MKFKCHLSVLIFVSLKNAFIQTRFSFVQRRYLFEYRLFSLKRLFNFKEINDEKSTNIEKSFDEMFINIFSQIKRKDISMTLPVFMYLHLTSSLIVDRTAMCFWITQKRVISNSGAGAPFLISLKSYMWKYFNSRLTMYYLMT